MVGVAVGLAGGGALPGRCCGVLSLPGGGPWGGGTYLGVACAVEELVGASRKFGWWGVVGACAGVLLLLAVDVGTVWWLAAVASCRLVLMGCAKSIGGSGCCWLWKSVVVGFRGLCFL